MRFYLGTHLPAWLGDERFREVPLFVSARRLARKRAKPAVGRWALDSGGFTELSMFGRWTVSPREYVARVRHAQSLGGLDWAAPQDWMCEEPILKKTGLTVREHQNRTVDNFLELRSLAPDLPIVPVLQGYTQWEYLDCAEQYELRGVSLLDEPLVGVGTICRRQATQEAEVILRQLSGFGIRCHAFGAKITGLRRYHDALASSDSLAWSFNARKNPPLPGCAHPHCVNCPLWALNWREKVLASMKEEAS